MWGQEYKGFVVSMDGYMNLQLASTEEERIKGVKRNFRSSVVNLLRICMGSLNGQESASCDVGSDPLGMELVCLGRFGWGQACLPAPDTFELSF